MKTKLFAVALTAAVLVGPAMAQDAATKKRKKGQQSGRQNNVAAVVLRQLKDAKLTDEQVAKVQEHGKAAMAKIKTIREEAEITPQLVKKRLEAQKSLKDSGKKGRELQEAINKEAGYNEAQVAALQKINQARVEFHKQVVGLLTDEQKKDLPQSLQRATKAAPKGKQRRKKQEN